MIARTPPGVRHPLSIPGALGRKLVSCFLFAPKRLAVRLVTWNGVRDDMIRALAWFQMYYGICTVSQLFSVVYRALHCCAVNHNGKLDKDRVRSVPLQIL